MQLGSAVSYNAKTMAFATRHILDKMDIIYTREGDFSTYSRFVVVMPLMDKMAYTYVFHIHHPKELELRFYDAKPGHSGIMTYMEFRRYEDENWELAKDILRHLLAFFDRAPWKFTTGQRLMHGYFIPEFWQAKRFWKRFNALTLTPEEKEELKIVPSKEEMAKMGAEEEPLVRKVGRKGSPVSKGGEEKDEGGGEKEKDGETTE